MTNEEPQRIRQDQPLYVSEMEGDGTFIAVIGPKLGTPIDEEQAFGDLAPPKSPTTEEAI